MQGSHSNIICTLRVTAPLYRRSREHWRATLQNTHALSWPSIFVIRQEDFDTGTSHAML